MNVFILKIIALITMMIDHYGAIFQNGIDIYRVIGRLAFPIYCFLLVEGYFHTRNVKKYGIRLLLFALISELPFDLAFYNNLEFKHQNIFFTLFIGLVTMYLLDNMEKYNLKKPMIIIAAALISTFLFVDYSFVGIVYILAFYFTKQFSNRERLYKVGLILLVTNLLFSSITQQFSLLALPLIYFYNGELGPKNKYLQMLFYASYPLHLLVYYLVRQ